ncbi:MAG TPA: hypothetical protein VJR29_02680 [bacterium]|nr:hypothetical protein [bacterium]
MPPIPRVERPVAMRHSLFDGDLVRRLEAMWSGGSAGDPPPLPPPSTLEGVVTEAFETFEDLFGTEEAASPAEAPGLPPSVDEALAYHRRFEKVSGAERDRLWRDAIARLRADGHPHLPPDGETYDSFRARLDALGAHAGDRIVSLGHALTLLHNHETLGTTTPDRPVAVVIGPTSDYNGAFASHTGFPVLDSLMESGRFHVLYFESADEAGAREALRTAHEGVHRRLHTVVFSGHGMRTGLALEGPDPARPETVVASREEDFIDISDLVSGDLGDLDAILEPDGQILMWSCSNGEGGADAVNLANGMAEAAPGRPVYSTPIPTNLARLAVREDLSLDLAWRGTESYVALHRRGDPSMFAPERLALTDAAQAGGRQATVNN